jgi:hypothetical protein
VNSTGQGLPCHGHNGLCDDVTVERCFCAKLACALADNCGGSLHNTDAPQLEHCNRSVSMHRQPNRAQTNGLISTGLANHLRTVKVLYPMQNRSIDSESGQSISDKQRESTENKQNMFGTSSDSRILHDSTGYRMYEGVHKPKPHLTARFLSVSVLLGLQTGWPPRNQRKHRGTAALH